MDEELVQAYVNAYLRRSARRRGGVFSSEEPAALAALALVLASRDLEAAAAQRLQAVDRITRPLLEHPRPSFAMDIAGIAWAEAYGPLPLREPPVHVLE